jgi:hypothetical protein
VPPDTLTNDGAIDWSPHDAIHFLNEQQFILVLTLNTLLLQLVFHSFAFAVRLFKRFFRTLAPPVLRAQLMHYS